MQPIIVGIDPGTTTAFAAMDFSKHVLKVKSKREYSMAELISDIYEAGNPILVGTDKKEVPSFIREFAQKTGSKIYKPKYDTKKGEKKTLVKDNRMLDFVKNAHETDALASALYAYNEYKPLIQKIDLFTERNGKQKIRNKVLIKVITEEQSIARVTSDIEKKPAKKREVATVQQILRRKELTKEEKEILLLREHMGKLKERIETLETENSILSDKRIDIDEKIRKIISFKEKRALILQKESRKLRKELKKKDNALARLNEFISIMPGKTLVKRLKSLGMEDYRRSKDIINLVKGDILLVDDLSIVSSNVAEDIREKTDTIIYSNGTGKGLQGFWLIRKEDIKLIETKYFAIAETERITLLKEEAKAAEKKDKGLLQDILEEYRRERTYDSDQTR